MVTKSELKYIQSLSDKKVRLETGCFIAEGEKLVGEMIAAGYPLKAVYALDSWESPDTIVPRFSSVRSKTMSGLKNICRWVNRWVNIVQPVNILIGTNTAPWMAWCWQVMHSGFWTQFFLRVYF